VAIQPIRLFGDPVLRTRAEPVVDFDAELRRLVKDLSDTMMDAPGVGLAAPQLGVSLRVFTYVVDDELGHLVNPDLDLSAEEQDGPEGCLSLPGIEYDCVRAERVVAKGFNQYGDPVVIEGSDLLARCIQHENDHLDGILFIDRMDKKTKELRTWGFKSRWGLYIKLYKGAEWEEAGVLYTVDGEIYPDTGEFEDLIYGG